MFIYLVEVLITFLGFIFLTMNWLNLSFFQIKQKETTGFVALLLQYLPSMVITGSNFVVPLLCDKIALLEKYSPSTTVILALLRLDQFSHPHQIKIWKRTKSRKMKSSTCLALVKTSSIAISCSFFCSFNSFQNESFQMKHHHFR